MKNTTAIGDERLRRALDDEPYLDTLARFVSQWKFVFRIWTFSCIDRMPREALPPMKGIALIKCVERHLSALPNLQQFQSLLRSAEVGDSSAGRRLQPLLDTTPEFMLQAAALLSVAQRGLVNSIVADQRLDGQFVAGCMQTREQELIGRNGADPLVQILAGSVELFRMNVLRCEAGLRRQPDQEPKRQWQKLLTQARRRDARATKAFCLCQERAAAACWA